MAEKTATVSTPSNDRPVLQSFADAYWQFAKALNEACYPPELQQGASDAQREIREAAWDPRKQFDVYRSFAKTLQQATKPEDVGARVQRAYEQYLKSLAAAWAQADPRALTPWHLAAINQSAFVAAWYAAAFGCGR